MNRNIQIRKQLAAMSLQRLAYEWQKTMVIAWLIRKGKAYRVRVKRDGEVIRYTKLRPGVNLEAETVRWCEAMRKAREAGKIPPLYEE